MMSKIEITDSDGDEITCEFTSFNENKANGVIIQTNHCGCLLNRKQAEELINYLKKGFYAEE